MLFWGDHFQIGASMYAKVQSGADKLQSVNLDERNAHKGGMASVTFVETVLTSHNNVHTGMLLGQLPRS